jgi:thymidylate synthase
MIIQEKGIYEAWVLLLDELLKAPVVKPRGKPCREKLAVQLRIADARKNLILDPQRGLNYRFAVAEWLWILAGLDRLDVLTRYNKQMAEFSDDGVTLRGAYGPRLKDQWPWLLKRLTDDLESRQGVVSIWTPAPESSKDVPCTLSAQYLVRKETANQLVIKDGYEDPKQRLFLHTVMTMRSSDAWWGIPYDVFTFAQLANGLAAGLSHVLRRPIYLGELVLNLGSSHLYEPHWETARSIVTAPAGSSGTSPRLPAHLGVSTANLAQLLTREPEPIDCGWWPWPWKQYAEVLNFKTSAEALVVLTNLERRELHGTPK